MSAALCSCGKNGGDGEMSQPNAADISSVSFENGGSELFEAADGWCNGSMFNVTWRKENCTFENGKMQLIINNDEVKCSHGATTGQLDEDALFYMRSRGIPADEARRMLMQAFMVDVIETVHIPGLQERLRHLVDRRFSGTLGNCDSCKKIDLQ